MNREPYTIGVLGGMGTYAAIHLFRQYAEVFPAEKEWERPRIIIDNRCTMPSRVRAALYGEDRDRLIGEMSDSIGNLCRSGCSRILLACNTAHLFLEDIYQLVLSQFLKRCNDWNTPQKLWQHAKLLKVIG